MIQNIQLQSRVIVADKYLLLKTLHTTKNSIIFDGYNKELQIPVIVKMMDIQNLEIDKIIRAIQGKKHQLKIYDYGKYQQYTYIVKEKCGPNLKTFFQLLKRFSFNTIILIALKTVQIHVLNYKLSTLQSLHSSGYMLQDLNISTMFTSLSSHKEILLPDTEGLLKYTSNFKVLRTNKYTLNKISKYSPLSQHLETYASPRDNLESLMYIIIDLIKERKFLKYDNQCKNNKKKFYFFKKQELIIEKELKNYPDDLIQFFIRIKQLNSTDIPINYSFIKQPLVKLARFYGVQKYDWTDLVSKYKNPNQQQQTQSIQSPIQSTTSFDDNDQKQQQEQPLPEQKIHIPPKKSKFKQLETIPELDQSRTMIQSIFPLFKPTQKFPDDSYEYISDSEQELELEDEPTDRDRSEVPEFVIKQL
ncbi:hypothetical protein pb186bvf_017617 [Paramecium bursaria]